MPPRKPWACSNPFCEDNNHKSKRKKKRVFQRYHDYARHLALKPACYEYSRSTFHHVSLETTIDEGNNLSDDPSSHPPSPKRSKAGMPQQEEDTNTTAFVSTESDFTSFPVQVDTVPDKATDTTSTVPSHASTSNSNPFPTDLFPNDYNMDDTSPSGLHSNRHPYVIKDSEQEEWYDPVVFSPTTELLASLYAILSHAKAPRYLYTYVIRAINAHYHSDSKGLRTFVASNLNQPLPTTRAYIEKFVNRHFPTPKGTPIKFPLIVREKAKPAFSNVVVFDPMNVILEAARSRSLADPDKIALDPKYYWTMHQPKTITTQPNNHQTSYYLNEMVDGQFYRDAYQKYVKTPTEELLVPFRAWVDETGTSQNLRYPVQPLLITCGLLKRKYQKTQLLAYVPCLTKSSAEKNADRRSKENGSLPLRNFHNSLNVVFEKWDNAFQGFAKKKYAVRLGNEVKFVYIRPVLLFFGGDAKSQDYLCGRIASYNSVRMCRTCSVCQAGDAADSTSPLPKALNEYIVKKLVSTIGTLRIQINRYTKELTNLKGAKTSLSGTALAVCREKIENVVTKQKNATTALEKCRKKLVQVFCTHDCNNSFFTFSSFLGSIFTHSPHDHMHIFLIGIVADILANTVGLMTDSHKDKINNVARDMFSKNTSSCRRFFPQIPLGRGVTNLTLNTAQEWMGLVFLYFLMSKTPSGKLILEDAFSDLDKKLLSMCEERILKLNKNLKIAKATMTASRHGGAISSDNADDSGDDDTTIHSIEHDDHCDEIDDDCDDLPQPNQSAISIDLPNEGLCHLKTDNDIMTDDCSSTSSCITSESEDIKNVLHHLDTMDELKEPKHPGIYLLQKKIEYLKSVKHKRQRISLDKFSLVLEHLLIYHRAAYSENIIWNEAKKKLWEKNTGEMIYLITNNIPRIEGNAWMKQKVHCMKHLPGDVFNCGPALNFDCMSDEHALQEFAKSLAHTVKKGRPDRFCSGLAIRLQQYQSIQKMLEYTADRRTKVLDVAHQMIVEKSGNSNTLKEDRQHNDASIQMSPATTQYDSSTEEDDDELTCTYKEGVNPDWEISFRVVPLLGENSLPVQVVYNRSEVPVFTLQVYDTRWFRNKKMDEVVILALARDLTDVLSDYAHDDELAVERVWKGGDIIKVHGYFQCTRTMIDSFEHKNKDEMLRCDPVFREKESRYDYVKVSFDVNRECIHPDIDTHLATKHGFMDYDSTPCKVICLYEHPKRKTLRAIIHPCEWRSETSIKNGETRLSETWRKETAMLGYQEQQVFTAKGDVVSLSRYVNKLCSSQRGKQITLVTHGHDVDKLGPNIYVVEDDSRIKRTYTKAEVSVGHLEIVYARDCYRFWGDWFSRSDFGKSTNTLVTDLLRKKGKMKKSN